LGRKLQGDSLTHTRHTAKGRPTPARARRDEARRAPDAARRRILEIAARVICEKGYEGAGVQDIAAAAGLTKAGLYYHIESKEQLLFEIQSYGMDVFEEQVLLPVLGIADPLDRLRACMEKNVMLVTRGWSKEVTIILHEHATLTGEARALINARKKRYVRFLEKSFSEAVRRGRIRAVNPKVAAFAFLGMVLWIYKWYRRDGPIPAEKIAVHMQDLLFTGLETGGAKPKR
jgi:AcrR family transcriptional regulator